MSGHQLTTSSPPDTWHNPARVGHEGQCGLCLGEHDPYMYTTSIEASGAASMLYLYYGRELEWPERQWGTP